MAESSGQSSGGSLRVDRCFNPFNREKHKGVDLRIISKKLLRVFPQIPHNAWICCECRKRGYQSNAVENSHESFEPPNKKKYLSRENQLEELLCGLKQKFASLPETDPLRLSILTAAPECWNIRQIASEFGCSERQAKKAKLLRKSEGVLATPNSKKGKVLSDLTIKKVQDFYECDQNSRIMPNKKDTIIIKTNGENKKLQKRLLLTDIKVLHTQFKEEYPAFPIGLIKFAELRPKNCVSAGASGTHSVCICVVHQNFKMMLDAL